MIVLDQPGKTLQVTLAHKGNRNEIPWTCCYKNFTPGKPETEIFITSTGLTNGISPVILMPGPKPGTVNELIVLSVVNNDNGRNVVSISILSNGVFTPLIYSILRAGRTLYYPETMCACLYSTSGVS